MNYKDFILQFNRVLIQNEKSRYTATENKSHLYLGS